MPVTFRTVIVGYSVRWLSGGACINSRSTDGTGWSPVDGDEAPAYPLERADKLVRLVLKQFPDTAGLKIIPVTVREPFDAPVAPQYATEVAATFNPPAQPVPAPRRFLGYRVKWGSWGRSTWRDAPYAIPCEAPTMCGWDSRDLPSPDGLLMLRSSAKDIAEKVRAEFPHARTRIVRIYAKPPAKVPA